MFKTVLVDIFSNQF